ncbi:hypothetical protein W97_05480 [Coniosporium apollinis CBS 100218]|uniref:Uncharacterized protein n=1 Tax=Coniosporium apollinis (strain CBS 100218) TaxID=1168221 RepID=R7YX14_CONA1|nr:uncharacterized protein W97_05480 [Coniosporium apollinis CBS 100218]EON66383.1 hypothetical protein W97_05480 [Coniosporium apollinis CBS 100218]
MFVPIGNNRTNGTDATVLADDLTWDYSGVPLTYPTQYVIYSQFNIQPDCSMTVTPLTITQTEVTKVIFPVATGGLDIGTDVIGFLEGLPEFAAQFNDTNLSTCEQEIQGGQTVEFPVPSDDATAIETGPASASVIPEATSVPAEPSSLPLIKPRLPIPFGPRTAALEFPGAGNYTLYGRQATGTGGTGGTPLPTLSSTFSRSLVLSSIITSDPAVPPLPPPISDEPRTTTAAFTTPGGNSGARAGTRTTVAVLTEATAPPSTSTFTRGAGGQPPTPVPPMQVNTPPGSSVRPVNPSQPPNPSQNPNPNPNPGPSNQPDNRPTNPGGIIGSILNPSNPPDNRPTNPGGIIGSLLNPSPTNGGNSPGPTAGGNPSNNPSNNPGNNPGNNPNNNPQPGQSITIGPGPPVVITPAPTSQGGSRPGGIILGPGSTLLPGQSTNINGVPVVLGPSGSNLVIGGSSTIVIQPGAPANPTPAQTVNIGTGAPIVVTPAPSSNGAPGGIILGPGTTLQPGQTTTINGVPVVAGPSGSALIIGGTRTVAIVPGPGATSPPVLTVAGATITANPSGAFVIAPGTTLTPGGPALTVSGTTLSLGPSGSVLVVNGVSQTLAPGAAITPAPVLLTIGTQTLTATTIGSATGFVIAPGTTLTPGGVVTVSGTTFSLPAASGAGGPTVVVVNGRTSTLGAATGPITAAPVLTIDGTTYAPTIAGGSTFYVLDGSTLRPGGVITVDGTRISLGPEGTVLVIGGVTSTATRPARNSASPTATTLARSEDVGDFVASGIGISSADVAVLARRGMAEGLVEGVVMGVVGMVMWML